MTMDDQEYLQLARKVQMIGRLIKANRDLDLESIGLTSSQSDAMIFIRSNPGCTINDLRAFLGVSHQAASALVDRMRNRGLLETMVLDGDRRSRVIIMTDAGEDLVSGIEQLGAKAGRNITDGLSEKDVAELSGSLDVMMSNLTRIQSGK